MATAQTQLTRAEHGRFNLRVPRLNSKTLATAACISFALLLFVGDVKGNLLLNWLPFDPTLPAVCLVLLLSGLACNARGGKVRVEAVWILVLFAAFFSALLWTQLTPYAINKIIRFFSISFMIGLLPAVILTRVRELRLFINTIVATGLLISMAALQQVLFGESISGRIAGINSDTISLGRSSGIALVGLYAIATCSGAGKSWRAIFCLPLLIVLIASGARGPAIFALLLIAFVSIRWAGKDVRVLLAAIGLFVALVVLVVEFSSILPQSAVIKIGDLLEQRLDNSADERVMAGSAAMDEIQKTPFGLGIGGFAQIYNFGNGTDRIYPHNIVLEIAVEEGWLVAALFLSLVLAGIIRGYRAAVVEPGMRPFFSVFLFVFLNSLVSGDINDNRALYALLCVALMAPSLVANASNRTGPSTALQST